MPIFKTFDELLQDGQYVTIVITKKGGKLTASTLASTDETTDAALKNLPPIIVTGTAEELDEGYVAAITQPVLSLNEMITSVKDYEAAKKAAAEKTQKAKDEKEAKKKAEEAAKKKEEEKKNKADKKDGKKKEEKKENESEETAPSDNDETSPVPVTEKEPVEEETNPSESAPEPEPHAPTAADVIKEDVQTLYKRGNELFHKGEFQTAKETYESARAIANANQIAAIDKAISACNNHLVSLFD